MKSNRLRLVTNKEQNDCLRLLADRVSALWNVANYQCRQAFLKREKVPSYNSLCTLLSAHPVYRSLPSDIAQETLKKLSEAWKSFFALRTKQKQGQLDQTPGLPRYRKRKDGSRPADWLPIKHPRSYSVDSRHIALPLPRDLREKGRFCLPYRGLVRFLGKMGRAEVIFDAGRGRWYFSFSVQGEEAPKKLRLKSAACDLGLRVLLSLSIEGVDQALHFLGRELLKDWDYLGRAIAKHQQELSHRAKGQRSSKRLRRMYQRRKARVRAAWEALCVQVVNRLCQHGVGVVYLGWPKGILRETSYTKKWSGRIHGFWSFDLSLRLLEKHLLRAGIEAVRVGERGTSSCCPWCKSKEVLRRPRYVLSCRACKRKLHSDQAGSRNILSQEKPRLSWDGLEASLKPDTRRWNRHRWVDASNRLLTQAPGA